VNAMTTSIEKGFYIETPNVVGTVEKIATIISRNAHSSIKTLLADVKNNRGYFLVITDKNKEAISQLKSAGYSNIRDYECLVIKANQKGQMQEKVYEIAEKLSHAGINIENMYTANYENNYENYPVIVISTQNNQKALSVLN
jgi:hypothetical protein